MACSSERSKDTRFGAAGKGRIRAEPWIEPPRSGSETSPSLMISPVDDDLTLMMGPQGSGINPARRHNPPVPGQILFSPYWRLRAAPVKDHNSHVASMALILLRLGYVSPQPSGSCGRPGQQI